MITLSLRKSIFQIKSEEKSLSEVSLEKLTETMKTCIACQLHKNRTQVVPGMYGPKNGLCLIGEAPGYNEDLQGQPFVGRSGKLLDKMLNNVGLVRGKNLSILNVVKCRPTINGSNRTPTASELKFCGEKWLTKQLQILKPKLIVTLGGISLKFFFPKAGVTRSAGTIMVSTDGYPIFSTFHPAYLLRNGSPELYEKYENHFKEIANIMNKDSSTISEIEPLEPAKPKSQKKLTDFFGM